MDRRDSIGAGLALAAAATLPGAARAQTVLRFAQFTPRTHFYHTQIMEPWIADIERATEGRVKIEVTTATLGPMPRNFDLVRTGVADLAAGNHGVIYGRFGVTQITEIPFEDETDPLAVSVALWRTHERFLAKANEHEGTQLLALHTSGSMGLFSRDKPIRTKADFAGMKWLAPTNTGATAVKNLGGVPVVKPVPEYYDTISKGVVDAMLSTNTAVAGWKAEEFIKHQTRVPGGVLYATFFVVMNKAKFDALEKRDQDAIMRLSGEAYARRAGEVFKEQDARTMAARRDRVQIIDAPPELRREIVKAFDFVDDEWLKKAQAAGIDGRAALDFFKQQVASLSKGGR